MFQPDVTEKYRGTCEIKEPTAVDTVRKEWPINGIELRGVPFTE